MVFRKNPIFCKLADSGKVRSMYRQTNALAGKNCSTAVHRGSLAFMVTELIIQELWIASAGIEELKAVDIRVFSITFFAILVRNQTYLFQNDLTLWERQAADSGIEGCRGRSYLPWMWFMSYVNLILSHVMRIKRSIYWIRFCRIWTKELSLIIFLLLEM